MNACSASRPEEAMHPVHFSRKLFEHLAEFAFLPSHDRRFLISAWLLAPVVSMALHDLGLEAILARLPRRAGLEAAPVGVERGEALVRIAFRRHPLLRGGCLPESITQYLLHSLFGPSTRLVIGVKRRSLDEHRTASLDWTLGAHAWIELDEGPHRENEFEPIVACSAQTGIWKADASA